MDVFLLTFLLFVIGGSHKCESQPKTPSKVVPSRQQLNDSCHKRRYWFMQILVEKAIKQFG